jgi:hypothetical protein
VLLQASCSCQDFAVAGTLPVADALTGPFAEIGDMHPFAPLYLVHTSLNNTMITKILLHACYDTAKDIH